MDYSLLKKTPFNGYDRDQVLDYVTQMDKNMREMQFAYENQVADAADALSQANACVESLQQSAAVLSQNLKDAQAQADEYKQKYEQLLEENKLLRENEKLYQEVQDNIDQLLDEVRQEAEQIKAQAHRQAEQIIAAAEKKTPKRPERSDLLSRVLRAKREIKGNGYDHD